MSEQDPAVVADPTPIVEDAPTRSFSQDDVDRIVAERLKRQKSQFADYDDLKTKAEEYDKVQAAQMSEIEKAQAAAKAEAERAAALAAELGSIKRVNEQRSLLVEMGFKPEAIENLAGRLSGDDADAWRVDADKFASLMTAGAAVPSAANRLDPPPEDTDPFMAGFLGK